MKRFFGKSALGIFALAFSLAVFYSCWKFLFPSLSVAWSLSANERGAIPINLPAKTESFSFSLVNDKGFDEVAVFYGNQDDVVDYELDPVYNWVRGAVTPEEIKWSPCKRSADNNTIVECIITPKDVEGESVLEIKFSPSDSKNFLPKNILLAVRKKISEGNDENRQKGVSYAAPRRVRVLQFEGNSLSTGVYKANANCALPTASGRANTVSRFLAERILERPMIVLLDDPVILLAGFAHWLALRFAPWMIALMFIFNIVLFVTALGLCTNRWVIKKDLIPREKLIEGELRDPSLEFGLFRRIFEAAEVLGPAMGFALTALSLLLAFDPTVFAARDNTRFSEILSLAMVATIIGLLMRMLGFLVERLLDENLSLITEKDGFIHFQSSENDKEEEGSEE